MSILVVATAGSRVSIQAPASDWLDANVWTDITPPIDTITSTFGIICFDIAQSNPNVMYCGCDVRGLWKSTNRGQSFTELGAGSYTPGALTTTVIDSPIHISVDPTDPDHLIVLQGVRGDSLGFWESFDGGASFTFPAWLEAALPNRDLTLMAHDPEDWNHILLMSHTGWPGFTGSGVAEIQLDTETVTLHDPETTWPAGTALVMFAHHLPTAQGNSSRWIVATDGNGVWLTTNAGTSWTQVSTTSVPHAGGQGNYTPAGVLYIGGHGFPQRSTDNGSTWSAVDGLPSFYYYSVGNDGVQLYAQLAYTGDNGGQDDQPFKVSPITDGDTWSNQPGGQTFYNGPYMYRLDTVNNILYAPCWAGGLFAMRIE